MLFTVLVIALVLGYVMFRLSDTPKFSDVDKVIDSVNALAETITESIVKNSGDVAINKASNEDLKTLYDEMLLKVSKNENDIEGKIAPTEALAATVSENTNSIGEILGGLKSYVTTTDLDENVGAALDEVLQFSGGEHLKTDADKNLLFCTHEASCKTLLTQ